MHGSNSGVNLVQIRKAREEGGERVVAAVAIVAGQQVGSVSVRRRRSRSGDRL